MNKKVTWNDLHQNTFQEIKQKYKLTDRQLEQGVRNHLDGASVNERRDMYKKVWTPENKR